ncbi:MAG: ThiF family adenylyltransferase [Planctomycetes bacterium]|nr:ThiF family adenylyltransferase [Planctomycetota bacterium]
MNRIHLTRPQAVEIVEALRSREGAAGTVENQIYALGRLSRPDGSGVVRVDRIIPIRPNQYGKRESYGVALKPDALAGLVAATREHGGVFVKFHYHPMFGNSPINHFSGSDDLADKQLGELIGADQACFSVLMAEQPHGDYRFFARRAHPDGRLEPCSLMELRAPFRVHAPEATERLRSERFTRAKLDFGEGIVNTLWSLHVGIIGCGGLGWRAACALADSGVGSLCLIEYDKIEEGNLPRLPSAFPDDVGKFKLDVLATYLTRRYSDLAVETHRLNIIDALDRVDRVRTETVNVLKSCDVVLLVTDDHPSRYTPLLVCEDNLIPYIHCGMHPVGRDNMFCDVSIHVPGEGPCACCMRLIDENEGSRRGEAYIKGARFPNVAAWNAVAAGYVANAVRMLAVPLEGERLDRQRAWRIGLSSPSVEVLRPYRQACDACSKPHGEAHLVTTAPKSGGNVA